MPIVRRYECGDCGCAFDHFHASRDEPPPECPGCKALESRKIPAGFSIGGGNASKAMNITQDIMEKDLGQSNFNDNQRIGDIAAITPPHLKEAVANVWKPSGAIIAAAKAGAQAAASEGRNPLQLMQRASKSRGSPAHHVPVSVVAKG